MNKPNGGCNMKEKLEKLSAFERVELWNMIVDNSPMWAAPDHMYRMNEFQKMIAEDDDEEIAAMFRAIDHFDKCDDFFVFVENDKGVTVESFPASQIDLFIPIDHLVNLLESDLRDETVEKALKRFHLS